MANTNGDDLTQIIFNPTGLNVNREIWAEIHISKVKVGFQTVMGMIKSSHGNF
jgi:hypothetical protein